MPNTFPANTVTWRVLLLRRNASEFLALEKDCRLVLPEIEIPQGCRASRSLNDYIKERWKIDAYSLYPLYPPASPASRFYAVEALQYHADPPEPSRWLSLSAVDPSCFFDPTDFQAIEAWNHRYSNPGETHQVGPFAKPGWLFACRDWVSECLEATPLRPTGAFVQCNASPTFSLIRFETERAAVWFKAVGEPNLREYALTVLLHSELPSYAPQILGTKPEWHAWLTLEADGVPLSQTSEFPSWRRAVRDLAAMQKESHDLIDRLLQSGARDVRTCVLLSRVDGFFSLVRELMARQVQERPSRLTESEIDSVEEDLCEALAFLERDGMPDSLLHLDLHPDNIITLAEITIFLDWAEGSVGHPFLSFAYFLEHFRRHFLDPERGIDTLTREYFAVWDPEDSRDNGKSLAASTLVALFAYAVSSGADRDKILRDPTLAGYYRSLARRMKRYGERVRSEAASFREVIA
jgi:hypothetical protein